ncbi:hypothetical protein [Salipiger pallidus]|uniref:hypothetical protein n=1 Tax=Salipiger pallidus TaxID=1775170 RepID=UPI00166A7C99|nr:hypothetical protein [Salipiger pallidus]
MATSAFNIFLQSRDHRHAGDLARTELLKERSQEVRNAAYDFQTFAAAYVSAVIEDEDGVHEARRRLMDNVLSQHSTVEMAQGVFSKDVVSAAAGYKSALLEFSTALADANTILEMRPFWEAASDVLVERQKLMDAIDSELGRIGGV